MNNSRRENLQRNVKLFATVFAMFIIYVVIDFSFTLPTDIEKQQYRIPLPNLEADRVYFFKADNQQVIIIRYSENLQKKLKIDMTQNQGYFVAYALGTYLSCPLDVIDKQYLKESCSNATYDFAGEPLPNNQNFTALRVPVYNFCKDFSCINLRL